LFLGPIKKLNAIMPGTGGACEGSQNETAIPRSAFRISTVCRSAILERVHKGERADLQVQTLTKVSLSSI
jgi:hypothetical protein